MTATPPPPPPSSRSSGHGRELQELYTTDKPNQPARWTTPSFLNLDGKPTYLRSNISNQFDLSHWPVRVFTTGPSQTVSVKGIAWCFITTTITTTLLAKIFFTGFNPWATLVLTCGDSLCSTVELATLIRFKSTPFPKTAKSVAQNNSINSLIKAIALPVFTGFACISLNLRIVTFATYYLFIEISKQLTHGSLHAADYFLGRSI